MDLMEKDRQRIAKAALEKVLAPDAPIMKEYSAGELAAWIESQAHMAILKMLAAGREPGQTQYAKVTLTMDVPDALLLVKDLRKVG